MATNIEQIFRSFVVNKFKEIQEENRNSENMDVSHNGELAAPGTEDASEGSSVATQNEGSSQTVTEDTESKPMETVEAENLEKESESKDLKTTDLSSDDDGKKDSSKKKSKKHKKHKSKKKKKKKKKEKNEKRSKSASSVEDQENASSESKSVWKPVISSPSEQDTLNTLSSQMEENVDTLPSVSIQDHNVDSVKEHPARPQTDLDFGFFGPKCPNEMHSSVSSNNLTVCEVEMTELSKDPAVDCQQNNENLKCSDENNEKPHTKCEAAEALQDEISLPQPVLMLSEGKSVELGGSRLHSEGSEDPLKQSDNVSSLTLQPQSKSAGENLSKSAAKSRSRSNSLVREIRSRSKSLTKVPKKQANLKSITRQKSRSSSVVRRRRSRSSSFGQRRRSKSKSPVRRRRSSSFGQRRRSKSKSPVRRRRSRSSTPARYSKSPIRSWWSKSIRNRQRSVSIERRRRSRTRSLAKRRRSRSRSSEKGHYSRTRSSAKRIRSRSRSANRRKSRSTSRKPRLRSRSASRRKSRSAIRTPPKSSSPSRKRKSKSASPLRRQKSKTSSPVRHRSRSRSAVLKRRSRSGAASRRHRSRSGSGSRRRKSRSGSALRRRRSRSQSVSRRRNSRSPSFSRRRRSRSPSVSRRRRLRSPSVSRRRRSRSPSVSRRRRSRSASVPRWRRSRSASVLRRRRSRSASVLRRRRSRSASVLRRRRSRSASVLRRRRSRSASVLRRRRSRSASVLRRRRSRSPSVSRRRRSKSPSVSRRRTSRSASRRRRSRSASVSRRRRSRSDSASKRHKSRTGSDTRRSGSGIQGQKAQSYSATKRKSRSTSVARGEQSTLLSSASKVQSREDKMPSSSLERRSRSKGRNEKSRSRSRSVPLNSKSVESEPALQAKSSAEQRIPGAMSLDENQLSISASVVESIGPNVSTVEKHDEMKLPDRSSTSLTEPKNCLTQSRTSSPIPCNDNAIEMESSESLASHNNVVHCSSTISVLDDHMKSTCFKSPTEQTVSSIENPSTECDMDIEEISFTPTQIDCMEQPAEVVNMVKISKEASEVENTKVVDLSVDNEQKTLGNSARDGTVCSSSDFGQFHGLPQLASPCNIESTECIKSEVCVERSMVAPLEDKDQTNSSCHIKPNMEDEPEFANKDSVSIGKISINAIENTPDIATSPHLTLSSTDPLSTCVQIPQESESIKCVKNAENAENKMESSQSSSKTGHTTSEGKSCISPVMSSNEMDLCNKQENIVLNSVASNESQNFPVRGSPSTIFPGSWKHTEEDMSANVLKDNFSHRRSTPKFRSPTVDYDHSHMSHESKEEILEASQSEADLQRMELKIVRNTLAAGQSFSSSPKWSSSHDMRISSETENRIAPSFVAQKDLLDNSTYKELVSNDYNFKETGESEVSHPIENKTIEVKLMKESKQTLSSMHIHEDLASTCQAEESNNLPVSLPYEVTLLNTPPLEVDKRNVHSEYSSMEEKPAPESAQQNISVPSNVDDPEPSRSKELTISDGSNIMNLTSKAYPRKFTKCLSTKIGELSSEENPGCMSVSSASNEMSLTDTAEGKMEIQRPDEVLSSTIHAESYPECESVSKPSPFNNLNESCTKDVDKFLYGDGAQLETSANSIPSNVPEVTRDFEKTRNARELHSLTVLREKQCFGASKSSDGNLEKVHRKNQEKDLMQKVVEHTVSTTETDEERFSGKCIPQRDSVSKHNRSVSLSKDSAVNDDFNSQEKRVKSCTPGRSPSLRIQQKVIPEIEERMNLEEDGSIQSLTVKEPELQMPEQSANADLRLSMSTEDPKLSPKPLLHETGRLSVSSVPVQFKFSKTFKTLGVSQLCSTSEDSSDVEFSKANTSSSSVMRSTTVSTSETPRSRSKTSSELRTTQQTADIGVEPSKSCSSVTDSSQSDSRSRHLSEKDSSQSDNLQAADDSQTTKHTFPHISNAASKLGVKQRQYRSRSVAQDSRTPSVDRGHASRSRSKSPSRRRRSHSKSSSRKKRSQSTARKKSSHSKSDRKKRSRSRGRKRRSQSKGKKKRSTSKLSAKRKRTRSKSSEKIGGSKSLGKQRRSRSTSKTRKNRLSKSPEKKGRSRSKSQARKNLHSKTATSRKRSRSKSSNRRRKSLSKSLSSRSRSRSVSASWKRFSHSKSSLQRKRSHSSSRSASPGRRSRSRNKRRSFSRSPAARSHSRSRSRWQRSRSRGRWRRSRSLSTSRRRSRSTSRPSLSTKKRKSLSPSRRRRSRSQVKQKDKSPLSKRKSTSPPPLPPSAPQKKSALSKPAGFKHSIGLKSLIQKQLSQAKSQGSTGKLSKEQISLPPVTNRTQLSIFSARTHASVSNLNTIGHIPVPNLADVPLPSVSAGSHVPMSSVPPAEQLSMSSLAAETQLSVPDLTTANQWHVPDMSGAQWSVPDIAAGTQWSMTDMGTGTQWPMSDLTASSHWPMHDMTVGAQWSMPDLGAGTQWAVPDVATGAQWAVPDLAAGTQWAVPDLTAGSQWAMANMTAGAQWAVPDLAATAQWAVPDLTAGAHMQRADLAPEAQVPGSDLALEAQVPGSDLAAEAQVPGSDLAAEAQVPGSDMVAEAQVPPEHDLTSEEHNMMPDVAAEALVPVASSTFVPDVAAQVPLPDVAAQLPVPDVAATIHMPDVATEAQKQMSDFVAAQAYMSLAPEESVENLRFGEPVVSSEHQEESDPCAFVQQSSSEPNVNTSQNFKEETLSSVQQLPLDCIENAQSTELNDKTISLEKGDLQIHHDPETDVLINLPQAEPAMESPLDSVACRPSEVSLASFESSDYSVHSVSVESNPTQEDLVDCHKSSDRSLQCEPHANSSNFSVESQSSPIQTACVEPTDDRDQPPVAVTNSMTDNNLKAEPYSADRMLMEEQYSKSVSTKLVAPYASPDHVLQNEPSVNSDTTLEIDSHSISDVSEVETCTPNHSQQVELNPSLGLPHQTERHVSPEQPRLVEPYKSPVHPQLVEPYTSPVHPQLVEPYQSPQHRPLVELYSSPEHPNLVEPYASPDFPQLVEPYASPDRQQMVEPYTDTEHSQISQPGGSPALTENTCSLAEKPEENSDDVHILTDATVTCTQINTDSSCSDGSDVKSGFSQVREYSITSDIAKKQDKIVDYPKFSESSAASVSVQEVPCPNLLEACSSESHFIPKETTAEECSCIEGQLVEPSSGSPLEPSPSPSQHCSPPTVHHDESFPVSDQRPPDSCSCDEPKRDSSCVTTDQQLLGEQCLTDEHAQSKEPCSVKEVLQPHKDFISSEQLQEKTYNIQVQPQENVQSPSIPHTNEECLNATNVPFTEHEQPSADPIIQPDKSLCVTAVSDTIINVHGEDPTMPLPDRPEQETIPEPSHSEESKAAFGCGFPDKLVTPQVAELVDKPPSSDPVVLHDSQDSASSSLSEQLSGCPNSFLPENSSNANQSTQPEYSTKINHSFDQTITTGDAPNTGTFQLQEFDGSVESPLPTKNTSFPTDSNQDKLECLTSNQASDLSVECMKHKPEDSGECFKPDNHFTSAPPDLLPYDSDQPPDVCSEPSSEPVSFNSQPPPELLPYDSEQPANSFLSTSDYSTEQGSLVFHAPPELLPYDSDQPSVLQNQPTEPTEKELPDLQDQPTEPTEKELPDLQDQPTEPTEKELPALQDQPTEPTEKELPALQDQPTEPTEKELPDLQDQPTEPTEKELPDLQDQPTEPTEKELPDLQDQPTEPTEIELPDMENQPTERTEIVLPDMENQPTERTEIVLPDMENQPTERTEIVLPDMENQLTERTEKELPDVQNQPTERTEKELPDVQNQPTERTEKELPDLQNQPTEPTKIVLTDMENQPTERTEKELPDLQNQPTEPTEIVLPDMENQPTEPTEIVLPDMENQPTEPTEKELPDYESTASQHEAYKVLDLQSLDSGGNGNSESLNVHEIPEKCEPSNEIVNHQFNFVKELSSECSIKEVPSTEQEFTSDTLQEHSVPSPVVDCNQEDQSSSHSSTDEHLTAQPLAENNQPVVQPVLESEFPERLVSTGENHTEQTPPLTSIPDTYDVQFSSSYELENTSESETSRALPLMQDEILLEATGKSSPPKSLTNAECPQPASVCTKTDPISKLKSRHERSRSIDRKESTSKSSSQNKRSRSKSVTRTEKSHSKSLVRSRRTKSRSASTESIRQSPSVVKSKESTNVVSKRSSRSASRGRKRRSRSSSLSPRKRSRSSSGGCKFRRRRSHSQSRQRHSRSPEVRRRSRSHSLSRRRHSPSSATRKKSSPSPATRRRRTPSPPASRRRQSPSATRRRRSRSPSATRRRRSRSPSATRRRRSRSPSATRRRRSRSPSATRRRRSPSPPASRRRRSPSPPASRRRRSPSPFVSRRRRSPSPPASRRRRSPSSEFRRKRSPSLSLAHKRRSPSITRKRRSRSTSASRRRRSRSASQRKRSLSPSASRKRKSKSKSPASKSPTGKQSKSDRSRSPSQSEVSRKRKSRSSSRDKKTDEKRRKRSSSKDSSKDYYSIKQRRKSRTPPRRKKSRSPGRRGSVCKSPVRRRRSRSPVRRKSFSRSPIRRKRSRSRDKSMDSVRSPKRLTDLDKAQLLEIAKANAAAMCAKAGVHLPLSMKPMAPTAPVEEKITHRTYGVTIQELTEKCKQIAQSKEDDVIVNKPHDSDDEEEDRPFYNHPFKVSEHKPISFSLLNPSLKPAPKNQVTLTKEFPVSSGSQHRKKESDKVYGEWVPVDKNTEESKDDVFTNTGPSQPVDITSAMNERAVAQTRLTGNPYDIEASYMLNRAQEQIDAWAQSTSIPGQFTGSTGAQVLSAEEISNSGPQAWLKKDQFLKAAPVTGGRGALLMRKMGWREGEGLGRNNEGNVDPILLDFKTDRKGLVADGEKASNKLALPAMKDLSGKHPISALMELCNKKKWSPPEFELVDDTGPEHRKRFLFRVTVNGVLCQPSQPSLTKKLAKATAAAAALQALGALPKESMTSTSNFCSASTSTL